MNVVKFVFLSMFIWTGIQVCAQKNDPVPDKFRIISEIETNQASPFYIDIAHYPRDRNELPIGIFDSGTGGLSVLNSIFSLDQFHNDSHTMDSDGIQDFINERFIYLADQANMPYGRYDFEDKADFLKELVIKDVRFLLDQSSYDCPSDSIAKSVKEPVKAIVIACNTATAYGLKTVRQAIGEWGLDIKVLGIVNAGAGDALNYLQSTVRKNAVIGVMATEGTCASNAYPDAILEYLQDDTKSADLQIIQQACMGLAGAIDGDLNYIDPLAETLRDSQQYRGPQIKHEQHPIDLSLWQDYNFDLGSSLLVSKNHNGEIVSVQLNSVTNYIKYYVTYLAQRVLEQNNGRVLDPVILGCTHYPFFEKEIRKHFMYLRQLDSKYEKIIPANITFIDPAQSLAIELYDYLKHQKMWGSNDNESSSFYISVPNPLLDENIIDENGNFPYSYKYGRSINESCQYVKILHFSDRWIDDDIRLRILKNLPYTYNIIYNEN